MAFRQSEIKMICNWGIYYFISGAKLQLILYIVLLIKIHVVLCDMGSDSGMTISEQLCRCQKCFLLVAATQQNVCCGEWLQDGHAKKRCKECLKIFGEV